MQDIEINNFLKDAIELEKNAQYKSAIEVLYQVLNKAPENAEIFAQIANLYFKLQNYEIALDYTRKALDQNPKLDFANEILLKIYLETKNIEKFKTTTLQYDTDNITSNLLRIIFEGLISLKLYPEAIDMYNKITDKYSFDSDVLYYFALCNYFLKDYNTATKYINTALQKDINNVKAIELLGNIKFKENKKEEAENILNKIPHTEMTWNTYYILGKISFQKNKYQEAVEYYTNALTLEPDNCDCLYSLANAYYFLGWFDEALKILNKAKNITPTDINILYLNAEIHFLQKKYDTSLQLISSILEQNSEFTNAKLLKLSIYLEKGLSELARRELKEILKTEPNNIDALKIYYKTCEAQKMYEHGIATLEKILSLAPQNINYMCKLAESLCNLEKWSEAKNTIKNIFTISSDYEISYELAIKIYYNLQEYTKATEYAKKWITINPNSDYAHYILAKINIGIKPNYALDEIMVALHLNPQISDYYILAANIYEAQNDLLSAYNYYKEAFDIKKNKESSLKLLQVAIQTDNKETVEKTYNMIKKLAPFDLDIAFLYVDYLQANKMFKAGVSLLKSIEKGLKDKDLKAVVKIKIRELA